MSSTRIEWSTLDNLIEDGLPVLIGAHWEEVGVHKREMPLAVDWERYANLENQKILRLLGAWLDDNLIGYSAFFYLPHLHYQTTALAANDAIFVAKPFRRTSAGSKLILKAEADFPKESAPGWCRITYHDRAGIELLGPVLRKRGYIATDTTYSLMVKE